MFKFVAVYRSNSFHRGHGEAYVTCCSIDTSSNNCRFISGKNDLKMALLTCIEELKRYQLVLGSASPRRNEILQILTKNLP